MTVRRKVENTHNDHDAFRCVRICVYMHACVCVCIKKNAAHSTTHTRTHANTNTACVRSFSLFLSTSSILFLPHCLVFNDVSHTTFCMRTHTHRTVCVCVCVCLVYVVLACVLTHSNKMHSMCKRMHAVHTYYTLHVCVYICVCACESEGVYRQHTRITNTATNIILVCHLFNVHIFII